MKIFKSICCFILFQLAASTAFAEYKKIVVVGAGLSGLTTAYRLHQLTGEAVEVYEARGRVGGRVLTAHLNDSYEELGGKFISDGGAAPHFKALVKEMGLEIESYTTVTPNRKYYYKGRIAPYYLPFYSWKQPDDATYALLKKWAGDVDNLGGLLDRFFKGNEIALHLAELRTSGYYGSDSKQLSSQYLDSFWKWYKKIYAISHNQMQNTPSHETIRGGNSELPEKLAAALRGHVHVARPVRKISKTHDGKQFVLEFPNSEVVTTDILILTIPCSTLRDIKIQEGIIPADQWHAIKTLQYGTNGVILVGVNLGDAEKSEYSETEDAITWFNNNRKILTLFYGGKSGIFNSHFPEDVGRIIKDELPALKMLFPSMKYNGKKQAVSWINEEYSKGSYCNWGVGQYELFDEKMTSLGEPVRKVFRPIENRIFFAGEHTALEYPTTMEGAVESGERAARMVAKALKKY